MDKITSKFGVVSLDAPDTRLPIHTNKSGPDAVWDMIVDNAKYKGYTINRADYEVSRPYTPEGATSNRVTRVDITNKSDPLFKIGSESYIDYVRHDMSVADSLTLPYSHTTLEALIDRLNSTSGVSLSIDDFDVDYSHRDDGIWNLKSSDVSYFFTPGTYATLYDRGGWTKIRDWFATDTIPDLRGLILNLEQPTWNVRRDAVNYIQSNRAFNIPWDDLIEHPLDKNADGSYRYFLDRKPLMEYIEPQWIQYRKLTLSEYMHHPGAATTGAIPIDRDYRVNVNTRTLYADTSAGGEGSGGFIPGTDILFVDTINKSYNRINIPTDLVGADWSLSQSGIVKVSFKSLYRKGRYSFQLGGVSPGLSSYVDNPIPELDRSNILGLGEEESYIPWHIEYFLDFTSGNRPLSTLFINGEFIWEGMVTQTFEELGATNSTVKGKIYIGNTANQAGTHSRLEITDFNLHVLPLGSPKESSYVQVNASVTGLSDGTVYENLPRLNEFYKVHLTEENVEDGPLSTTEPTTLVARDGDVIIEAESEFIVDTAPDLASVFLNTKLDGFDGYDKLGPGQQVSHIGYEYPDGRHTRYMGRVDDTEFFTPEEVMEAIVGDSGITHQIPYSTTQWFKYQLDGDIVYVPMKPLANHISYNELKSLGVVNRSGDHLARVPANTVGNYKAGIKADYRSKIIHKDGRAYVVRMIKGLNEDGPMLPYVNYDSDNTWTHDSEWNRMFYNLTRQTILPAGIGDNHASQKGPKWEFISAADLVVENNGSYARYTLAPEFTIEGGVVKPIYRGCYGISVRGRNGDGPDHTGSSFGFRPMLKLIQPPNREYSLDVYIHRGKIGLDFSRDSDFDVCRDPELFRRRANEVDFTRVETYTNEDFLYEIDETLDLDAEFYATHSDLSDRYTTKVLVLTEDLLTVAPLTVLGAEGKSSGIYNVVDDLGNTFPAYVDMETDGGGWILAARWTGRPTRNVLSNEIHWEGHEVKGYTEDPVNYPVIPEGRILKNRVTHYMVKSTNPSWKEYFGDWSVAELNTGEGVTTVGFPVRTSIGNRTMYLLRNGWSMVHLNNDNMGFWTHGNNTGPCGGNNRVGPNKCCPMAHTSDSNHGDFSSHVKEVYLKASAITPPKGVDPIEGELIRYHQDFTGTLPDYTYASLAGRTAAGKYPTSDTAFNTLSLGYWNLNMQPYSSGWGSAGNTTRYISSMISEISNRNYRAIITSRYRLGNSNRATTNRWDMGITFTTDDSFDLNVRDLRIVVVFKNIGAQTNIGVYDHTTQFVTIPYSNQFRHLELILSGTRLKVMLDDIILREGNCVYVGTSHTYSIGLGVRYTAVNRDNVDEPLWGMEISNMYISTIPKGESST